jgi:hypothetical protein
MGARPDPQVDPIEGDPPHWACGHAVDGLSDDHPTPDVCLYRQRAGQVPAPLHPCGHPIGAGIHRSSQEVAACQASASGHASYMLAELKRSFEPGWRGGRINVTAHGSGPDRVGSVVVIRYKPGFDQGTPLAIYEVKQGRYLPGDWVVWRVDGDRARCLVSLESFDLALNAAIGDASAELQITLEVADAQDA